MFGDRGELFVQEGLVRVKFWGTDSLLPGDGLVKTKAYFSLGIENLGNEDLLDL